MSEEVTAKTRKGMDKALESLRKELSRVRTGRASQRQRARVELRKEIGACR